MGTISRRGLMFGGAAIAAIGAAGILAGPALASQERVVIGYLRRELPGLAVGDDDMKGFVETFLRRTSWQGNKLRGALLLMDNPGLLSVAPEVVTRAFDWFSRRLLTDFLFSTNFFGDAGRSPAATRYVAYADPYAVGCRNPLARYDLEP